MKLSKKNKALYFFLGVALCFLVIFSFFTYIILKKSHYYPQENIIIEKSATNRDIAHLIIENKISENIIATELAIKFMKLIGYRAKIGEYALSKNISIVDAIKTFASNQVVIHKITIPEGFTINQAIDRINNNKSLLGKIENVPEEGSIMPDTYCFRYPTTKQQIISMAQMEMDAFMKKEWPKKSPHCTLKTPREAIILASIVEKEAITEKKTIAGVYLNRLKKNMRLQSCPTVIYAITKGKSLGRKLCYSDLKIKDRYNTYRNAGLPPTAIVNPGRESILATLHPKETEYLFFVFNNKDRHIFSKTFQEHQSNKKKIQKSKDF